MDVWLGTFPLPGRAVDLARMLEDEGWDGLSFTDSQNLAGDPFVGLGLAAQATSQLKLATGATNPTTRHPAVVASSIATIQAESGGRAVLGIARGDSALAYLGRKPTPLAEFRRGLEEIQGYLRGEVVDQQGYASRLEWLADNPHHSPLPAGDGAGKVPMAVAATGPRVIELAAQVAERVTFSLGAMAERLRWAIDLARSVNANVCCGAYVNAVAHPDVEHARELVRGRLGVYARFSSMHENTLSTVSGHEREVIERLAQRYDMKAHATSGARHASALDDDFVDTFGIVGPSERVAERLRELAELGLDHVIIAGHGRDVDMEILADTIRRFGREVIPRLKA